MILTRPDHFLATGAAEHELTFVGQAADDLENFLKQSAEPPFRRLKVELVEHTFNGFDKYPDVDIFHLGFFGTNVFGKAKFEACFTAT